MFKIAESFLCKFNNGNVHLDQAAKNLKPSYETSTSGKTLWLVLDLLAKSNFGVFQTWGLFLGYAAEKGFEIVMFLDMQSQFTKGTLKSLSHYF